MFSYFLGSNQYDSNPADDFWYGPVGRATSSGVAVSEDSALRLSAVWACTNVLCASGSSLPLNLLQTTGRVTRIAYEHPVYKLIHSTPNPEMTAMRLRSTGIAQQVNGGNFFAEIVRDMRGQARQLWPIHYSRVKSVRANARLAGIYNVPEKTLLWEVKNEGGLSVTYLRDDQMFHVPAVLSEDGIMGAGVIDRARESIGLGLATEQQGAAYFANSARPAYAIVGGKFKTGQDREDYRRMWMETHGGPVNNAKPAMLPEGSDLKPLGFSQEDSQFLGTRQFNVEDVARWYNVPLHLVGHLLHSHYANIEHSQIHFVVHSLIPRLVLWEQEIDRKLLTEQERETYYSKHVVVGLLRGDSAARAAFYRELWQLGALSINEIREKEDFNPIGEGGDEHFVQTSYTTVAKLAAEEPEPQPVVPEDEDEPEETPEDEQSDDTPEEDGLSIQREQLETMRQLAAYMQERPQETVTVPDMTAREQALRQSACLMIEHELEKCLSRETVALSRAATKQPSEFFIWLDDFYDKHQSVVTDSLRRPVQAYFTATGTFGDPEAIVSTYAASHVQRSREEILRQTEIPADQWGEFGERAKRLAESWKAGRILATEVVGK